jgi:hypothetical protein
MDPKRPVPSEGATEEVGKKAAGGGPDLSDLARKTARAYSDIFKRTPGAEAQPGGMKYALVCFPLDPVPMNPGRVLTIGRSKQNDLILPVGMVSREHSRIQWSGSAFEIEDLGSSNGTYVNESEVKKQALKDGDEIKIGPYNLTFRSYEGDIQTLRGGATEQLDVTQNITRRDVFGKSSTFAGAIGEMRLDEVFQLIEFNKKTGTLYVKLGEKKGAFHFKEGQVLDAEFHKTRGVAAVARALSLPSGDFSFSAGDPAVEQSIFQPTGKVILDAMRKLDELDR